MTGTPTAVPGARRVLTNGAVLVVSAGLMLLVAELALRATACRDCWFVWPPNLSVTASPSPDLLPGVHGLSRLTTNSDGIRGDPMPTGPAYRILAVGGSTTECLYLDDSETWTSLLQQRLNARARPGSAVWVGNIGRSGHNSRHNVLQVERVLAREPHIDAILVLVGINDFALRLAADTAYTPNWESPSAMEETLATAFAASPGWAPALPFYKRSETWRRLRILRQRFLPQRDDSPIQDGSGAFYTVVRKRRADALRVRDSLPDLTSSLREYRRNLERIVRAARARGTRVVLATQPALWARDLPAREQSLLWFGFVGKFEDAPRAEYYSLPALTEGLARYNAELLAVCGESGAECVDLAPAIPRDTTMFYDDVHFNEGGARRVAELFAAHLLTHAPFGAGSGPASPGPR